MLVLAVFVLAMANFMAMLDISIANVALPHIAGALAVSPNEGTSVITFFAVAEAITIPLTGWLAQRFGSVRVFLVSMAAFGVTSFMCGLAMSLPMLVFFRILQGLAAGPMMPLSQALLAQVVPKKHYPAAVAMWASTVIVAPVLGPFLGGFIADNLGWEWAFYINIPVAIFAVLIGWRLFASHETPTMKRPIDYVGFGLMVLWIGALQTALDIGAQKDWFDSLEVNALLAIAAVGFVAFLIWELTAEHPIVDLKVFRHRSFAVSTLVISAVSGIFFASLVLIPLWLQTNLGYTAEWAGNLTAFNGMLGIAMAPVASRLISKFDARAVAFAGIVGLAFVMFMRTQFYSQMSFSSMAHVQLMHGAFMPLFFVPLMAMAFVGLAPKELAGAAGLLTFARTIAGAIGASVATTAWGNATSAMRTDVVGGLANGADAIAQMEAQGLSPDQALANLEALTQGQSVMLATNQMFAVVVGLLLGVSLLVWLTPKPARMGGPGAPGGH
ncbi:MAG: DHA2 family efflux MFS transporter permease subunit [Hyphomonadaceae bacterium]|nr:DHA2 family efflux MFS transporter permease subunit [Hyphomonadaceae bacterium]